MIPSRGAPPGSLGPRVQRSASQKSEKSAVEALGEGGTLVVPLSPGRLGPMVPAGARWASGSQALRPLQTLGASDSKAGCTQHWPLAVKQRVKALKSSIICKKWIASLGLMQMQVLGASALG